MLVFIALAGLLATVGSIVVALVPPPEEGHPAIAVLKVAGTSVVLVTVGALLYGIGNLRASRQSRGLGFDAHG